MELIKYITPTCNAGKSERLPIGQVEVAFRRLTGILMWRRSTILFSTLIMSTSPQRRSPSLESMSSMSSAFSFDVNPGITSTNPLISVQSASQGGMNTVCPQAEQEDWLPESERIEKMAFLRDEHSKSSKALQAPVDAYPMHGRFCFPAENIYFLVRSCCATSTACSSEVLTGGRRALQRASVLL